MSDRTFSPTLYILVGPHQSGKNSVARAFIDKLKRPGESATQAEANLAPFFRLVKSDLAVPSVAFWKFFQGESLFYRRELLVPQIRALPGLGKSQLFREYTAPVEDAPKQDSRTDEENNKIFIGVNIDEIVSALESLKQLMQSKRATTGGVLVSVSQSAALLEFIEQHERIRDIYRTKAVVVDAPSDKRRQRLLQQGLIPNVEQLDKVIALGEHIVDKVHSERYRDTIPVDNYSTIEEALKQMYEGLVLSKFTKKEQVDQFYEGKKLSEQYMQDSDVQGLLEHLMQRVMLEKPTDPLLFMTNVLKDVKQKAGKKKVIITKTDIETMFDLIDVTQKRTLSREEIARWVQRSLSLEPAKLSAVMNEFPSGKSFTKQDFTRAMLASKAFPDAE